MATAKAYGNLATNAFAKKVDWVNDDIKAMLVSSSYTPNQDTHAFLSDVTGEVSGTGYSAGGASLTRKTAAYDGASNTLVLDAADVTWANSTVTARYVVVYDNTGASSAAKPLVGYVDLVTDQASNAGNFTIQWDASGIIRVNVA